MIVAINCSVEHFFSLCCVIFCLFHTYYVLQMIIGSPRRDPKETFINLLFLAKTWNLKAVRCWV